MLERVRERERLPGLSDGAKLWRSKLWRSHVMVVGSVQAQPQSSAMLLAARRASAHGQLLDALWATLSEFVLDWRWQFL